MQYNTTANAVDRAGWLELQKNSCFPTIDTYHSQGEVVEEVVITLGWDLLVWRRRVDLHLKDDVRV